MDDPITKKPNRAARKPAVPKVKVPTWDDEKLPDLAGQEELGALLASLTPQELNGVRTLIGHMTKPGSAAFMNGYRKSVKYVKAWLGSAPQSFKLR